MKNFIGAMFLAAGLFLSGGAQAQERVFGLHVGYGIPSADGVDGGMLFGLQSEYLFTPEFGLGAFYTFQAVPNDFEGLSSSYQPFGISGNYHFSGLEGAYAGVNMGIVTASISDGLITLSSSKFSAGIHAGFDAAINEKWLIGGEAKMIHVFVEDSIQLYQFYAQVKYVY